MSEFIAESTLESIYVNIVVDTKYLKEQYPNPSKDYHHPTGINHNSQFMVVDNKHLVEKQGTADLVFKANSGDLVSFTGTSIEANSSDAVIVYGIKYWQGDKVFNDFFYYNRKTLEKAVMPSPNGNGLPPSQARISFMSLDSRVANSGTEHFYVYIAVYEQSQSNSEQILYGYFYWDPSITVK